MSQVLALELHQSVDKYFFSDYEIFFLVVQNDINTVL